jgi:transcriptional regulator of aromatic amino acid metabolism
MPDAVVKHLHAIAHPVHDDATGGTEYVDGVMAVTGAKESRQALESAYVEIQSLMDRLQSENIVLREEIDQTSMFEQIVGVSQPLRTVLSQVSKVAPTDSTVLISGETGTGTELIARAIHKRSSRSARAFVTVNCAAIPSSLMASELFSHEKGAFTGALQRRQGRVERPTAERSSSTRSANSPPRPRSCCCACCKSANSNGSVAAARPSRVNVRVIAATNRDLRAAVADGTFRADLFYRLNVFPLDAPCANVGPTSSCSSNISSIATPSASASGSAVSPRRRRVSFTRTTGRAASVSCRTSSSAR